MKYVGDEERVTLLGLNSGQYLFVVIEFVETGEEIDAIRIISVRYAIASDFRKFDVREQVDKRRPMTNDSDPNQRFDINNPPPIDPARFSSWKDYIQKRSAARKAKQKTSEINSGNENKEKI